MSATALTKGSGVDDEGAAGAEVTGGAEVVVGGTKVVVGGGRVVVGGGPDIADTRLIGSLILPRLQRA
jgi:hypothetical protein